MAAVGLSRKGRQGPDLQTPKGHGPRTGWHPGREHPPFLQRVCWPLGSMCMEPVSEKRKGQESKKTESGVWHLTYGLHKPWITGPAEEGVLPAATQKQRWSGNRATQEHPA